MIDEETKIPIFRITVGETEYTDRKEATKAFETAVFSIRQADRPVKIVEFQGFPLSVTMNSPYIKAEIQQKQGKIKKA